MSLKVWGYFWQDPAFTFEESNSCAYRKDRSDPSEQQLCSDKRLELAPFSQAYNMVVNPRWAKVPFRNHATEGTETPHLPATPAPTSCCTKEQCKPPGDHISHRLCYDIGKWWRGLWTTLLAQTSSVFCHTAYPANVTSWKYVSDDILCQNHSTGDRAVFPA